MDLYVRTQMVTPSLDLLPRRARWLRSRSGLLVLGMVAAVTGVAALWAAGLMALATDLVVR